jgi:hypothetical protein
MASNDRFEVRKSYRKLVEVISDHWDEPVEYLCQDLSPRGAFLKTNVPLCAGESVLVSFCLPGVRNEFNIFGTVTRVDMPRRQNDWGTSGMGVEFTGISPKERFLIRQGLKKTPPPLPFQVRLKKNDVRRVA